MTEDLLTVDDLSRKLNPTTTFSEFIACITTHDLLYHFKNVKGGRLCCQNAVRKEILLKSLFLH
jgi:hypothetical protein